MNIIHSLSLSLQQAKDIRSLTKLCARMDGCTLSCPEDGDAFWLLYEEDGGLGAFFAVYKIDASTLECYAFTRPDSRGRGYFSALLEEVCTWSREAGDLELCFVTDNRCRAALDILEHLEAEFWYNEYMMERSLGQPDNHEDFHIQNLEHIQFLEQGPEWNITASWGSCRLTLHGDRAYLYGLEILPDLRGQGLGTRLVSNIIFRLEQRGLRFLDLQVSGTNEAALGLYKKTGFTMTQTLSYYLY